MKFLRQLHLYLGCFFAPLLLFFILTGWHQMFHDRQKNIGEGAGFWNRLSDVHVDQLYFSESAVAYSPKLFQYFAVLMSLALIVTILLGVVLAWRALRQRWLVLLTLVLGILVPVFLLWIGQRRE